ncbi:MAG: roadblock/LC7 domain-containing protein [Planctomycetota bacterium]|jgi:predicted regulator of Ras-like GTPase activity (Roadblock/LC7/MglB family)
MQQGKGGDVYRLVFELTARATDVPYDAFLVELVQGLAAHYQARICRLHIGEQAAATADADSLLSGLDPDDRSRYLTLDSLLAAEVREDGVLRTALDLDGGDDIVNFLGRKMGTPETFAFPLMARGRAFGAITLYLLDAYPFEEADVRGLQAVGNVLYAATNKGDAFGSGAPGGSVPVTSEKLRQYQETLGQVGKILDELLYLTDAKNVMLLDAQGDFISKRGEESHFASTAFASVVASGFGAASRLGAFYGAGEGGSILHEGTDQSVFVKQVSERALLCVVYEDHQAPHLIERWAGSAATRLAEHYESLTQARAL